VRQIYLDNGATSFPKAPGVVDAMTHFLANVGSNTGRGIYESSFEAEHIVYETRELIAELFHFPTPSHVIFTKNITESINVILKGILRAGDHVIVSSVEHNAVMRPLHALASKGITFSKVKCSTEGVLNPEDIRQEIKKETRAVVMTHASNVSGTILDLESVGQICRDNGIFFIVDAAQTVGFVDVDFQKLQADAIAFTGHKSLLGPQGMGGFIVSEAFAKSMTTFIEGGTGSLSDRETQPEYLPDKFEAGTLNIPGIYGLHAALQYLNQTGLENIQKKELHLVTQFILGLQEMEGIRIIGKKGSKERTGVVSIDVPEFDNASISYQLYAKYGIATRCGMHCAPSAHETLGTFPQGTVRFSFSHFNEMNDVTDALKALKEIISEQQ